MIAFATNLLGRTVRCRGADLSLWFFQTTDDGRVVSAASTAEIVAVEPAGEHLKLYIRALDGFAAGQIRYTWNWAVDFTKL